ncbi:unnamed protein product [Closterium sp. Naga37s-1]|nr:unnamed protein product [Closterium sp. Naga37s-1]
MIRASLLLPATANPTHDGSTATAFANGRALLPAPAAASASVVACVDASAVPRATLLQKLDAGVSGGGCWEGKKVRGGGRVGQVAWISGGSLAFRKVTGSGIIGMIDPTAANNWLKSRGFKLGERGALSGEDARTSSRESWRFDITSGGSRGRSSVTVTCSAGGSPSLVAPPDTSYSPRQISILFAAGGTGGHVYPAIAIADAVRFREPTAEINFIGTRERREWTAVPRAGYRIHPIPAVSIRRPLLTTLSNLLVPFRFLRAFCLCLLLIWRLRPNVVVGTGGYVSAPTCLAAAICRIPLVLQEQNAFAGIANRLLGRFASVVFVAFAVAQRFFPTRRCHVVGNPTRAVLRSAREMLEEKREAAINYFFPRVAADDAAVAEGGVVGSAGQRAEVVLVLGGSLGAQPINTAVAGARQRVLDGSGEGRAGGGGGDIAGGSTACGGDESSSHRRTSPRLPLAVRSLLLPPSLSSPASLSLFSRVPLSLLPRPSLSSPTSLSLFSRVNLSLLPRQCLSSPASISLFSRVNLSLLPRPSLSSPTSLSLFSRVPLSLLQRPSLSSPTSLSLFSRVPRSLQPWPHFRREISKKPLSCYAVSFQTCLAPQPHFLLSLASASECLSIPPFPSLHPLTFPSVPSPPSFHAPPPFPHRPHDLSSTPYPMVGRGRFEERMDLAYAAADVVVARADAVTCAELLIPSPHVAEDHQTVNARAMVQAGAAVMLPQDQLSPDTLLSAVTSLLVDGARREKMNECAGAAATADAADVMA